MSFTAENNRIQIRNSGGDIIFDTDTPMPHIVQEMSKTISHTFGDVPHDAGVFRNSYTSPVCTHFVLRRVCERKFECGFFDGEYECRDIEECGFETVVEPLPFGTTDSFAYDNVSAAERQSTYTIGTISNSVSADFILVKISGSRGTAGNHWQYGTFVSALPSNKTIAGNGSAILESSYLPGGQSWLRRIVSVYVSGNKVYAQFKHSNRAREDQTGQELQDCFPTLGPVSYNSSSSFSITFDVLIGKFTQ